MIMASTILCAEGEDEEHSKPSKRLCAVRLRKKLNRKENIRPKRNTKLKVNFRESQRDCQSSLFYTYIQERNNKREYILIKRVQNLFHSVIYSEWRSFICK